MTVVDFAKVRASLADKPLVGFEGALQSNLDKAVAAKCGLIKPVQTMRGILKVNGAKRGIVKVSGAKRGIKPTPSA